MISSPTRFDGGDQYLDLIDKLLLEEARVLHHGEEPLGNLEASRSPEVDRVNVLCNRLARN